MTLSSDNLQIPLNNMTYQFCWRMAYLGIYADIDNNIAEVNEENNIGYYSVVFDCGGIVIDINVEGRGRT